MSHSMDKLERRLFLAERTLQEARRRRADLEACLADTARRASDEEQRVGRAREHLASLEHRQEVQRQQLEHWQRQAEEAQLAAGRTSEELAEAAAADRGARARLNAFAVELVARLAGALPWRPVPVETAAALASAEELEGAVAAVAASADDLLGGVELLRQRLEETDEAGYAAAATAAAR